MAYGMYGSDPGEYFARKEERRDTGLQNLLNMIIQMKMMKKQEAGKSEQQQWENALAMRQQEATEKYRDWQMREQPKEPQKPEKPSAIKEKADMLIASGMPQAQAYRLAALGRPTRVAVPEAKETPRQRNQRTYIDGLNTRINSKISKIDTALSNPMNAMTENIPFFGDASSKLKIKRERLGTILDTVGKRQAKLGMGESLSKIEEEILKYVGANLDRIENGTDEFFKTVTKRRLPIDQAWLQWKAYQQTLKK